MTGPVEVLDMLHLLTKGITLQWDKEALIAKIHFPFTAVKNCISVLIFPQIDLVLAVQSLHKSMQLIYIFRNRRLKLHISMS